MQPNQQDPYAQNTPPAGNSNIPEYLHMDPIIDPSIKDGKRKKKRFILLLVTILVVVIAAGAVAVYWYLEQNSPQQRLYRALESALSVKYVNKKITYHKDGVGEGTNIKVDSTVDLSDPSNALSESKVDYSRQIKRDGKVVDDKYLVRTIKTTKLNIFAESSSGVTDLTGLEKNKWLTSELVERNVSSRLEEFDVSTAMYGSQIVPVMGNYSSALRSKVMDMIKSDGIFEVVSTTIKDADGKSLTGMRVGLNRAAINELNKMIAAELKPKVTYTLVELVNNTNYEDLTLWIDDKNTIVGIDYRNRLQNEEKFRITSSTVFTYLDETKINEPNR